ncbi:V-type proton ATPase subunit F-like [Camellia sinensis]|uniref:V-type proton ATPase subunit F-like n=1 Tax=Camellia sinensis TaxID=4442 RepID=UPI001036EEF8|nr:V-type proton ATPase subunit F-like [Camellia sinensis]
MCSGFILSSLTLSSHKDNAVADNNTDHDTITGFLLAGVSNVDLQRKTNYLIVDSTMLLKTTVKQIEEAFKAFTTREDVAIVMISQYVANMIKFLVDSYNNPIPTILDIPSKDHPYDPTHDSVLSRVKYFFSDFPILCVVCLNVCSFFIYF